ncbi:DNA (cytosine-5-)-methyltransferase [Nesterenkonia rhizosphaerae]|uniref:Cytosine-specific methyltransferase n=1 Tax=Nesterenkonia rhizosphaerae TaxID=1348272 RepID=A0ABP9G1B0_9MICC
MDYLYRLGELFSGPGGLGLGASWASARVEGAAIEHAWASDYDLDTCQTYSRNVIGGEGTEWSFLPPSVIHADIREYDISSLPPIDALAFGAPCNDFSQIGEKKGFQGDFGPLYSYGVQVLKSHKPRWFLFENVGGIRGGNFERICADFEAAGYRLYPHYYDFSLYGVPQKRRRVIVVGIRNDLDVEFKVPAPVEADISVRTALCGIPADAGNHEPTRTSPTTVARLRCINPGQNAWTAELPEHLRINTNTKIPSMYRRLDPEKPSYTVTGGGGGGYHIYHWDEPRPLTSRERARLQSFPDDFVFVGGKESVRKQIGMAVPPRGAAVIFEAILKSFTGEEYAWVESNMPRVSPTALKAVAA